MNPESQKAEPTFKNALDALIDKYRDSANVSDAALARYLIACLRGFEESLLQYGHDKLEALFGVNRGNNE